MEAKPDPTAAKNSRDCEAEQRRAELPRRREEIERELLLLQIEASRANLSEVFQRSPSFTALMSGPRHVFELVNDRYLELVGFRNIIGKSVTEALPELDGQGFIALLDQAFESGETISMPETPITLQRRPDGPLELRHVEFVYQPMRSMDGTVSGVLVQGIDVAERKRAEAAAQERDERLRLLIGHASDYALIMTCPQGRIMEWQGGAEGITGWSEKEVIGLSADMLFVPEDRARGVPDAERLGAEQNGRAEDKRWHMRKDGSRFFSDGVMTSLWSSDGELKGFGKVIRDVTEREQAEEAAREAEQHKDEFIALLAHELRNPLAPIRNGLQMLRLSPNDADAVVQAQAMMERQLDAHGPADRRPARRVADQPQQDGAAPRPGSACGRRRARGGNGPPG